MKVVHWIAVLCLTFILSACHQAVVVAPSLGPIDDEKQRVERPRTSASSCTSFILHAIPSGGDPVALATDALKTTPGVDGFVSVTVEQATYFWLLGHTTCTTVSANPFKYGTNARASRSKRKTAPKTPVRLPSSARTTTPVVECTLICERFGRIMETNQMLQRQATQRCNSRCERDRGFQECVTKASTSRAARFCETRGR